MSSDPGYVAYGSSESEKLVADRLLDVETHLQVASVENLLHKNTNSIVISYFLVQESELSSSEMYEECAFDEVYLA